MILAGLEGFRYRFTRADWDMACRALRGEAGDRAWQARDGATILWCMTQRLWLLRDVQYRGRDGVLEVPPHTFRGAAVVPVEQPEGTQDGLVEDYCQPVNPYFLTHGTPEQKARRRRFQFDPVEQVAPPQTRLLVSRFMAGRVPMLREELGVVHFAAPSVAPRGSMVRRVVPGTKSSNVWYTTAETRTWSGPVVWFVAPTVGDLVRAGSGTFL